MTNTDPVQVLVKAREMVAQGWTQRAYNNGGCFCALGAIRMALGDGEMASEPMAAGPAAALVATLDRNPGEVFDFLVQWNDNPRRTKEDVLDVFDRTIARLGNGG